MTTDIRLRPLEEGDIDDEYCRWYDNSDGHLDYFTGSGRSFDFDVLTEDYALGLTSKSWYYYLIETEDGEKIGNVKIGPIDHRNKTADLVCLLGHRAFLGQGLASKAIRLAIEIAFKQHDIRRLHSGMYETNVSSIKAYTRAGWFVEGTMRGYYWVDGQAEDRVCVACLNPKYFKFDASR